MIEVACVRTGYKYSPDYVFRLQAMVSRHLAVPFRFTCFTDDTASLRGIHTVDIGHDAPGWWGKMSLFAHQANSQTPLVYFDLDTVIVGSLAPLARLKAEFGICGSFTRAAGNKAWPCAYGSCVMTMAPGFGREIAEQWRLRAGKWMQEAGRYGDQWVIERLHSTATILQDVMPSGFFLGYRDIQPVKPDGCAVVIFAGSHKPHTCDEQWIKDAWTA